ncbi:MAG: thioredoxin domain-containing protein [Bacteroidales bacterium]|nr:thioredoxin domain-containing protein [Bacteroidales bacterium]MDY0215845.1 thioredoxin domain-containing protein [Bacteroidales bacterium]
MKRKNAIRLILGSILLPLLIMLPFGITYSQKPGDGKKSHVLLMNKSSYIKMVYDYEKNPNTFIYKDNKPSVIDFYADWCAPCRKIAPIMDELSILYKDRVNFYKVNVDFEKELASVHGIRNIPVVMLFPVSGEPQMAMGALQKEQYIQFIENILTVKK